MLKSRYFLAFLFGGFMFSTLTAKQIGMNISYAQFMNEEGQAYVEIYFALTGKSIDLAPVNANEYKGGVQVTVKVLQDSTTIVAADKFLLQTPNLADTLNVASIYINQSRLLVPNGNYTLEIDLVDINDETESYVLSQDLIIDVESMEVQTSDIVILESYTPAKQGSIFSKSGYDMVPFVNTGSYYFTEEMEKLSFYLEIYNTDKVLGQDSTYLIKYYLKNLSTDKILNGYANYSKKQGSSVQPLLSGFSIENLPTGNYSLVFDVLDKKGKTVLSKSLSFYRKNNIAPLTIEDMETVSFLGTFADRINNLDSLYEYTKYLYPISAQSERNYQQKLLAEQNLADLKRYFFVFWSQRNQLDPESAWLHYYGEVKTVNQLYSSRLRKGYMTERGRVFLTYGRPDIIERRQFEPNLPPYEMWQYNNIMTPYVSPQVNKFFVFAEMDLSTNDYQLVHSTAIGELNNRRWKVQLAGGKTGVNSNLDENSNGGSDFGSRLNNNLNIQGSQNNR